MGSLDSPKLVAESFEPKHKEGFCGFLKQFLFLYWHLLLCWIILGLILITSVIFYSFCQQSRYESSELEATTPPSKLDTTVTPTTAVNIALITGQVPYFPTKSKLDGYQSHRNKINAVYNENEECPLNIYLLLIILSTIGLVAVIILGIGASFLNK